MEEPAMRRICARWVALLIAFSIYGTSFAAESGGKPLRASELLGLVAGNALPENVVSDIDADHLAFRPDDNYRALLKTAGADPKVLAALDFAKTETEQSPEAESGKDLLQHLANAASMMNSRNYDQASTELKAALAASLDSPDCYFVVGELMRRESAWDQAVAAYKQVLSQEPDFPEAHAKLSYALHRTGDADAALLEAEAAVKQNPSSADAHKVAGLALDDLRKFDASEAEYKEALRLKPDYWAVHYDWGILLANERKCNESISEYKKAIALGPPETDPLADMYYGIGWDYDQLGNFAAAINAYRQAKTVNPKWYDPRQNLGHDLIQTGHYAQAVIEFRELEALFPNSSICHDCLASALYDTWDFNGAEKEYQTALRLDPTDATAHVGLGGILEERNDYDGAIRELQEAEKLDPTISEAYRSEGRVEIKQQNYAAAISQLAQAEQLAPADPNIHDLYGQALVGLNKPDAAIAEFQQSLALQPNQIQVMLRLACAFEKKGDWVAAIGEYRKAAGTDASIDLRGKITRSDELDPQKQYKAAQDRLAEHLAALRASGKASEASAIESGIRSAQSNASISDQLDAAMRAGSDADRSRHFQEAIQDYQHAVDLADKIQPHDPRLVTALDQLGNNYFGWNASAATSAYEQELKAAQDLFGPESPNLTGPLQSLGRNALMQHDYATAEKFFFQAVDVNEKVFGESSDSVANSLIQASAVYFVQKDYAKAEPYVVRAVNIDESLYGKDSIDLVVPLSTICALYDRWGKPDKVDTYRRQLLLVLEKQYGANSPVLVPVLVSEAKTLRALGKNDEA
jgi:tetratricopeptide (TPR) repeat protein